MHQSLLSFNCNQELILVKIINAQHWLITFLVEVLSFKILISAIFFDSVYWLLGRRSPDDQIKPSNSSPHCNYADVAGPALSTVKLESTTHPTPSPTLSPAHTPPPLPTMGLRGDTVQYTRLNYPFHILPPTQPRVPYHNTLCTLCTLCSSSFFKENILIDFPRYLFSIHESQRKTRCSYSTCISPLEPKHFFLNF